MDIYDNTGATLQFGLAALEQTIVRARHDQEHAHEVEYWEEELHNARGEAVYTYRMWKTKACGEPDCHHPQYSPCPV